MQICSPGIPQLVLMTKVDEACPDVADDLKDIYISQYIRTKVRAPVIKAVITKCFVFQSSDLSVTPKINLLLMSLRPRKSVAVSVFPYPVCFL